MAKSSTLKIGNKKSMQAHALEEILGRLLHSEVLLTLAGLKPVSIVHGFTNHDEVNLWSEAVSSGLIHRSDLIWRTTDHHSGLVSWFASKSRLPSCGQLPNLDLNEDSAQIFHRIDTHTTNYSEVENHRFWGKILGYPHQQIEKYALAWTSDPDLYNSRFSLPFFPTDLGSEFSGLFTVFDPAHDPEITQFHNSVRTIANRLQEMRRSHSYLEIWNSW